MNLITDKNEAFAAVKKDDSALYCLNKALRADKDIVLAAIKQTSYTLEFASDELQKEIESIGLEKWIQEEERKKEKIQPLKIVRSVKNEKVITR